jgi:hypothetical protein
MFGRSEKEPFDFIRHDAIRSPDQTRSKPVGIATHDQLAGREEVAEPNGGQSDSVPRWPRPAPDHRCHLSDRNSRLFGVCSVMGLKEMTPDSRATCPGS